MRRSKGERVFSVKQVAGLCHVSTETIRRWIRGFGLGAYNTAGGLAAKITEADLRRFAEEKRVYVDWARLDEDD